MADSAAPAPIAVIGGRGTKEDDAMTENKRWWQAYLAALAGMHAYGQSDESYSIAGADRAAAQAADMALTRWRAIGAQAESSGETAAALYFAVSLHGAREGAGEMADTDTMLAEVKRLDAEATPEVQGREGSRAMRDEELDRIWTEYAGPVFRPKWVLPCLRTIARAAAAEERRSILHETGSTVTRACAALVRLSAPDDVDDAYVPRAAVVDIAMGIKRDMDALRSRAAKGEANG